MTDLPMANFYAQGYTGEVFGADTTGKQLSNEVTRFDVKWSVRLIGYAGYMRDTCHTDLIFLKINNLCTDPILDTVHLHHRSW